MASKTLKNRKFALSFTIVVMILATLFGVRKSLKRITSEIDEMFTTIYYNEKAERIPIISEHLTNYSAAATHAVTFAKNYPELASVTEAVRKANDALSNSVTVSDKYKAYSELDKACKELYNGIEAIELPERDHDAFNNYNSMIVGARIAIENNPYNDYVKKYQSGEMYSPIVKLIKPFVFVNEPQMFGP